MVNSVPTGVGLSTMRRGCALMIQSRSLSCILVSIAILPVVTGCGMASGKANAEIAVAGFHRRFNDADFDGIWADADDSFRRVGTHEQYDKLMSSIHRKLGRVTKSTMVNWSAQNMNLTS